MQWLTWHPRGNIVLAGANDGSAWMWGAKGMLMNVFNKHNGPTTCGSFSPDGTFFLFWGLVLCLQTN